MARCDARPMRHLLPPAPPEPALLRWLGEIVDWSIVVLGSVLVAIVFANVVMHQLHYDIAWTTEFGEFVMVWTTFLGAAAAARRRGHMAITELSALARGAPGRALQLAIESTVAVVLVLLSWYGAVIVRSSWGNILTVLDWPMAWQYMALPVGSAIALVYVLRDLLVLARGGELEQAPENVS
jgi:TRAP-type C4-dicarboxylate transport system permease small subunit